MQCLVNIGNIDLGECSECVLVVVALVIIMLAVIYFCFKYAMHKDEQVLKSKKGKK